MSTTSTWVSSIREFSARENFSDLLWLAPEREKMAREWFNEVGTSIGLANGANPSPRDIYQTLAYMSDPSFGMAYITDPDNPRRLIGKFDWFGRPEPGKEPNLPLAFCLEEHQDIEYFEKFQFARRFNRNGLSLGDTIILYYVEVAKDRLCEGIGSALVEHVLNRAWDPDIACLAIDLGIEKLEVPRVNTMFKNAGMVPSKYIVMQNDDDDPATPFRWQVFVKATPGFELVCDNDGLAIGTKRIAA